MLLDQQGGGRNNGNLFAILNGFESRPHGNLGLTKTHIAGDETIHRDGALHIGFDLIDRGHLIGGFHKRECLFELSLPRCIGRKCVAGRRHAGRIQRD